MRGTTRGGGAEDKVQGRTEAASAGSGGAAHPVVVLGAGITGLAAAWRLASQGIRPVVMEAAERVGGLSASVPFLGRPFDYGPHGFAVYSSKDRHLLDFFSERLGGRIRSQDKFVQIKFRGRMFDYPLRPLSAARQLGLSAALGCGASFAAEAIRRRIRPRPILTAEDFFISNYGRRLYRTFFEKYTEKVWGRHPSRLSSRFLLKRMPRQSVMAAIVSAVFGRRNRQADDPDEVPFHLRWHYPQEGGAGGFPEAIAREVEEMGGRVLLGCRVDGVRVLPDGGFTVTCTTPEGEMSMQAEQVISTLPVTDFAQMLTGAGEPPPHDLLVYRAVVIACLALRRRGIFEPQNIYFQNRTFNRVALMCNYSPANAPDGEDGLTAEMTCDVGDDFWSLPDERIIARVTDELVDEGLLGPGDVAGGMVLRYAHGYPVYVLGYERQLLPLRRFFAGIPGLYVAGRQGLYSYAQMHFCVRAGFAVADAIVSGGRKPSEPEDSESLLFV